MNNAIELGLGSIVRINDHDLELRGVRGVVTEISLSLDEPQNNSFVVQNYKTKFEDIFSRIVASTEQMNARGMAYERAATAITPLGGIGASFLQSAINSAAIVFSSGIKSNVSWDEEGIIVENGSPYLNGVKGQVLIKGGGIFLSDRLDDAGLNRMYTAAITPSGINANLITAGRLDTEKINIYSGDQIRFSWKADGLFAYKESNSNTYVRYNEDGLLFWEQGARAVELGWNGLYIGSQKGSVELTGSGGLEIYNAKEPRELLVKLGGFGTPDMNGVYPDYGMRLYKKVGEQMVETLVSSNDGQLWLRESLLVGMLDGTVGLTGAGEYRPVDSLYNINYQYNPGDYVESGSGLWYKNIRSIMGGSLTDTYYWQPIIGYTPNDPIRIWAGQENPELARFSVTHSGALYAREATISGSITATTGYLGGENGWVIDTFRLYSGTGTKYVELNTNPAVNYFLWAGNLAPNLAPFSITKEGGINASKGTIGGFTITETHLYGGFDNSDYIGLGFYNDYRIWAGNPSPESAPFSVTKVGYVRANSGLIGGFSLSATTLSYGTSANDYIGLGESGIYRIWAGDPNPALAKFSVTNAGAIYAESGIIGGFVIGNDRLYTGIGTDDYVGLGTVGDYRIWAGNPYPSSAPFSVTKAGYLLASSGLVGGFHLTSTKLYYGSTLNDYVALGHDGDYRIWAGNPVAQDALFSVTKTGHLFATSGQIDGPFMVSGNLSSFYFASGAFGNGWKISGDGSAEFNDVYVRGTIAASVFEYQTISSVGGALYIAPAIITLINSIPITMASSKYVFTIQQDFSNAFMGGREWALGDYVSLSGFVVINGTSYEVKDIKSSITGLDVDGIVVTSILDNSHILCYNSDDEEVTFAQLPLTGGILLKKATIVFLGTVEGGTIYNKGILLTSISLSGEDVPFIDVYDDKNSVTGNPKVRLGNLAGITDNNFGMNPLSGYGLYSENAYLTGSIIAQAGYIGGPNGWVIKEGALYNGGRSSILQNTTGMYLGTDGFGLGGSLLYKTDTNELIISGDSITMGPGLIEPVPLADYIDNQLGYRLEVLSTSNILSSDITEVTIYTRVYKGQTDVTADLPDSVFHWMRVSNDAFADGIWNNNPINQGRKTFTLSTLDVYYSATFTCSIVE